MIKMLFLDYRDFEVVDGFRRAPQTPLKCEANPLLVSNHSLEGNRLSFYGSVVRRPEDGLWQMWYTTSPPDRGLALGYAESADGVTWRRPRLDEVEIGGQPTHLVFDKEPHGATVMYDQEEPRPDWKYKMIAGAAPSHRISAFRSGDGIHWLRAAENPVIGTHPDCPMSLHRARDGRYVLYVRPGFGDRRVARRESWDFVTWSEAKIVIDQEPFDEPQTQFYGLGAIPYGAYEIGTLWIYQTVADDMGLNKMLGHQQPELAYTRTGYAWHRASLGHPWIALGESGTWEWGQIQPASSPVLLEDEIRFYYAATRTGHGVSEYSDPEPRSGIGYASVKPDRFVGVVASEEGVVLTRPFWTETPEFYLNASVADGGRVLVGVTDLQGQPIEGFDVADAVSVRGDSTLHRLRWRGEPDPGALANREIRLRLRARGATLFALMAGSEQEARRYWDFDIPPFLNIQQQRRQMEP